MIRHYQMLWKLLNPDERRIYILLIVLVVFSGVFEMLGVAAILPFLQVLANPDMINENDFLSHLYVMFDFSDVQPFMIFLGGAVLVLIIISIMIKALALYAMTRFTMMRGYTISTRLLTAYLRQPYTWFLNRHSSDVAKTVLEEVNLLVQQCMLPAMRLIAAGISVVMLCALLVVLEPVIALGVASVLGGVYGGIYLILRNFMLRIGEKRVMANRARFHSVQEATGGLKDLKIMGLEMRFMDRFRDAAFDFARHQHKARILAELPRFLLEGLAFGGLILILLYLLIRDSGNVQSILPTIGLIAMASLRLMPALQQVYQNLSFMRSSFATLQHVYDEVDALDNGWDQPEPEEPRDDDAIGLDAAPRLSREIELDSVTFRYPQAEQSALNGVSIHIPVRSSVALVGTTGAGKTSVVDVILGLLRPDSGALRVDGVAIDRARLRSWQDQLGYVPQQIYLSDGTIASNIAFGLASEEIDMDAVERASHMASLHDFVTTELPNGYATEVGERGVRLSGGQRQRVGIARALYHDPEVLILDEATSALDNVTERAVMEAVDNVGGTKTVIIVAHRLSTVKRCDTIFLLEHGRLIAQGKYEDLVNDVPSFRKMAVAE